MALIEGDIHDVIKTITDNTIDCIYTDPPFGITGAKWDTGLRWEELWDEMWRVLKDDGAVILHSSMPFTFDLVSSQRQYFKYNYVWKKNIATNFFLAKKQPLRIHEDICVFYKKQPTYNPQMKGDDFHKKRNVIFGGQDKYYGECKVEKNIETDEGGHKGRYPNTLLEYPIRKSKKSDTNTASTRPDELVDFFIKTYTNEGETILDLTCYDALTGKRCESLNREYIGVDLEIRDI
jgi:DNA modification methylase